MSFNSSFLGVRVPQGFVVLLAFGLALLLTVALVPADATTQQVGTSVATDSDRDGDLDRPTLAAAAAAAQSEDEPVEALSKRTESTRTFANPDGTWSDEVYVTEMRVKDAAGKWEDVDYDLKANADGSFAPAISAHDVRVSGGGTTEAARLTLEDGESLAISWPTVLPKPTIDGGVATYKLSAATDFIVATTATGVSTRIRLSSEPAADDPVFTLGLRADDLDVDQVASGGLKMTNDEGEQVAATTQLEAWDAVMDEGGDPKNIVPVTAELKDVSSIGDVTKHELKLRVEDGFLSAPSTVYPVTIDPDLGQMGGWADTWVRSGTANSNGNSYRLQAGRVSDSSNTNPVMSYIVWPQETLASLPSTGRKVKQATIHLYSYLAGSCSPRNMNMYPLLTGFNEPSTVWTNRPAIRTTETSVLTQNRGKNDCAGSPNNPGNNGYVTGDITAMVDAWANGAYTNYGMQLNVPAANASDPSYERRFCSRNLDASDDVCKYAYFTPYLTVTYNTIPAAPTHPRIEKILPGDPQPDCGVVLGNMTESPIVRAEVADAEGSSLTPYFQWSAGSTVSPTAPEILGALTLSGATAIKSLPIGAATGQFSFRVRAQDQSGDFGPYSTVCSFTVDAWVPETPMWSGFPTEWVEGNSYNITLIPGGDTPARTVGYAITLDDPSAPTAKQFDADGPAGFTYTHTIASPEIGGHVLRLWAYGASGAISEIPAEYPFEVN